MMTAYLQQKHLFSHRFTLVELLVAMAVFSVLLMLSFQIFSGAQTLWSRAEQKNSSIAAVRTAMEFLSSRIQTVVYTDEMPFVIANTDYSTSPATITYTPKLPSGISSSGSNRQQYGFYDSIYFVTAMPMNRPNKEAVDLRFLSFSLHDGKLEMHIVSQGDAKSNSGYLKYFPTYLTVNAMNAGFSKLLSCRSCTGDDSLVILENVIAFRLIPHNQVINGSVVENEESGEEEITESSSSDAHAVLRRDTTARRDSTGSVAKRTTPPYLLEIEIAVLDTAEHYTAWQEAGSEGKKELETQYAYTFRRAILLNDRR